MNIKQIIKRCITEVLNETSIQDPSKEEMMEYLRSQFGNEEGFEYDAEAAIYWFANDYHGGQDSNLYSALSTSDFSPGQISRGPQEGSMEEMMYQDLVSKYGGANDTEHQLDTGEYSHAPEMRVRSDEPRLDEAGRTYYTIVTLQYNDAKPVIDLLNTKGPKAAIQYMSQWDMGGENEHSMSVSQEAPWGTYDKTYKVGKYTLVYDRHSDTVSLVRFGTKLTEGFDPWSNGAGANLESYEDQNAKMRKMEEDLGSDTDLKTLDEKLPPKFPKKIYDKLKKEYPNNPDAIYATAWKLHKKLEEEKSDIQHHCCDCGKDVSHPSKPGSCKVMCPDCLEVSQHLVKEGMEIEGMEIENHANFGTCKGCGRVVDKGTDKCPKCRETQDKTSLPPKRMNRGAKRPADAYGNFNEENIGITSNPLEGKSNVAATSFVNKVLAELSRGLFSDNSWEQIHKIFTKLKELGLDVTLESAKYGGHADTSNGIPKYKEWQISIPFTNNKGKPTKLVGNITAHGAGSVEQPLDKYDISAYVNAIAVR